MGQSATGLLFYGYDLGGHDRGWNFQEVNEYGTPATSWWSYDEYEDVEDPSEFTDALMLQLGRKLLGREFEHAWRVEGALKKEKGLLLETYGHYDYPGYVLATYEQSAYGYGSSPVELPVDLAGHDGRINAALDLIGLTPTTKPGWILASSYG